jgi:methyl-accepting chemotaxis protein
MAAQIQEQQKALCVMNLLLKQRVIEGTAEVEKHKQIEKDLRQHMQAFADGDYTQRIQEYEGKFGTLSRAFNEMAAHTKSARNIVYTQFPV